MVAILPRQNGWRLSEPDMLTKALFGGVFLLYNFLHSLLGVNIGRDNTSVVRGRLVS